MKIRRPMTIAVLVLCASISAFAGEIALLRNGFSIRHDRREQIGDLTRLFTSEGYVDVPTDQIVSFEKEEAPVPAPPRADAPPAALPAPPADPNADPNRVDIDQLVREASEKRRIDPDFVNSVIKYESNFHPRAVSSKGAQGLMQLMPGTAAQLGVTDAFDPKANVEAGTEYLFQLLTLYDNDPIKALAAYNAGPHRVEQYHGVPPYRETRMYISHIVTDFNRKKQAKMKDAKGAKPPAGATAPAAATNAASGTKPAAAKSVKKSAARGASKNANQRARAANNQSPVPAP